MTLTIAEVLTALLTAFRGAQGPFAQIVQADFIACTENGGDDIMCYLYGAEGEVVAMPFARPSDFAADKAEAVLIRSVAPSIALH
jgi:hypothetical protein